eukprot:CAMPEP_0182430730 /NCGR_PEP_ID=MMETSP1167-20130531/42895_1 /TAXON_ID=2988 /ORGANISM="Mallomonas Sp, Strain CCMP3275" /LENGTH=175 /DNA_ID=CAMNT_0024616153 /DNA_START=15 /DNA_END=538 /DNA_ORIENTATION=-
MERTLPLWYSKILPELQSGRNVMLVAHGNSLRGIVKHVDGIDDETISEVGIPNGIPLVYKFDKDMNPIPQEMAVHPLTGVFLEKKGLLRAALAKEMELAHHVPGYTLSKAGPIDPKLRSLALLDLEKKLVQLAAGQTVASEEPVVPVSSPSRAQQRAERVAEGLEKPVMVIIRHG